ncbi:putative RNA-directed DNA polymerase from transposon BS [Nephila pilipes]|uniref:Putative RNA-directed DNA polymerase from transposon BS n=1 Tax=Nephila pilipes TaxID=299642 RepID=A0A8X6UCT6_NEPPI|nr:putative RNA-directed DNA polymerase from transposon BS [Nephila pilipes]
MLETEEGKHGSVLSPTLFALYLSGLEQVVPNNCEIRIFADNIVIWRPSSDLGKLENGINVAPDKLWNFAEDHKLSFNSTMYKAGFLNTNRKLYGLHRSITLNHQPHKHPKYFGFVLDSEILNNKHIDHLMLRARRHFNILKDISGRDWGANTSALRNTYTSLV